MTPLLVAHNLTAGVSSTVACRKLDLTIQPGSRWAVLGRNGVGKTTLLRTFAGLEQPRHGSIALDGKPLVDWPHRDRAKRIGMLFQDPMTPFPGTVLETALIGRHPHIDRWRWEDSADVQAARGALAEVELGGFETRNVATLSGGELQRLAVAALLSQAPDLYLLDEPVNHLDLRHQIEVLDLFCDRASEGRRALVMVLHDVNLAARYCDHVLMLFGEGETRTGRATDLLEPAGLERLYGHPISIVRTEDRRWFAPA